MVDTGPNAVGCLTAITNESSITAAHDQTSFEENGAGFGIGSAGSNCVFTIALTLTAVNPATAKLAIQPPTANPQLYQPSHATAVL